ncbi:MAG: hypothetical protein LQ352_002357 [Teloschistes flavicans]|nr:MAG: hypothetical protein LQ352_002357 [Teloschistes flavicans]
METQWPAVALRGSSHSGPSIPPGLPGASPRYPTLAPISSVQAPWSQAPSSLRDGLGPQRPDEPVARRPSEVQVHSPNGHSPRRSSNRDEFDGPHQFLNPPSTNVNQPRELELPHVPTTLLVNEQDDVLSKVNDRLSQCAFDFVAKYQFPIPLEDDKRPVQVPSDREWTEWVFLLKRLATKRRIPARVLYNGQIKQLVTILENSLEMRHAAKHQSRPLKDDRNILQLISAGLQVAKMLKDAACMQYMDSLYLWTEETIKARKTNPTCGYLR